MDTTASNGILMTWFSLAVRRVPVILRPASCAGNTRRFATLYPTLIADGGVNAIQGDLLWMPAGIAIERTAILRHSITSLTGG
jgi:hypothetical protein